MGGFLRVAKLHCPISAIWANGFINRCTTARTEQFFLSVIGKSFLKTVYRKRFVFSSAGLRDARHRMTLTCRWASCQTISPGRRHAIIGSTQVQRARTTSTRIPVGKIATKHPNVVSSTGTAPHNAAKWHEFVWPRSVGTIVASRQTIFGLHATLGTMPDMVSRADRGRAQQVHQIASVDGDANSSPCRMGGILPLRTHSAFWKLRGSVASPRRRDASWLEKRKHVGLQKRLNDILIMTNRPRRRIQTDSSTEYQNAKGRTSSWQSNPPSRDGMQVNGTAPSSLVDLARTNAMRPYSQCKFRVTNGAVRIQFVPTGNSIVCRRSVREGKIERDLPGASANECAGLTFLRRCMQMFRDMANRSVLRRQWLFHQETRKHRGGSFVEPLFEKGINFLFEIGRVVQAGQFKRLKCRNGGLLKILPRRADTSGTHFGGLLG